MENLIREDLQKGFKLYVDDLRFSDADDLKVYLDFVESAIDEWNIFKLNYLLQFTDMDFDISIYKIIRNLKNYEYSMKFGFYEINLDDYGWLKNDFWTGKNEVVFKSKKNAISNKVKVAKGLNNVWTYALSYGSGYCGGGWSVNVYGERFKTHDEALIEGLKELINRLENVEQKNFGTVKNILELAKYKLTELIKIDDNKQLLLF